MASALDPPPAGPTIGPFPIAGLVRQARRIAGLGQRQMARFAGVAASTVGRVETGEMTPSLQVLERLLGAAGLYLAVVDQDGRVIQPMADWDDTRDGAGRRYPSHLKLILDPRPGEWWADILRPGPAARDLPSLPRGPGSAPTAQPVGGPGGEVPWRAASEGPAGLGLKRPAVQPVGWTAGRVAENRQSSLRMVPTATGSARRSPGTPATSSFTCSSASTFWSPRTVTGKAIDVWPAASVRQPTYES